MRAGAGFQQRSYLSRARARVASLIALALAAALVAHPAFAGDEGEQRMRELFTAGIAQFDLEDYAGAARSFEQAYAARENPVVLFNLGLTYEKLDDAPRVAATMRRVLEKPGNLKPERLERARELLDLASRVLGELEITCAYEGARVDADGVTLGRCPFASPITLREGTRLLRVTANGYEAALIPVDIRAKARQPLTITLSEVSRKLGELRVMSTLPDASVVLDGQVVGTTPLRTTLPVSAGEPHRVELRRQGYVTATETITVQEGATLELALQPALDLGASAELGRLVLTTSAEGARLMVDGQRVEAAKSVSLPAGIHDVVMLRDGFEPLARRVRLEPGARTELSLTLVPTPETRATLAASARGTRNAAWATLVSGSALASAGIGLLVWNQLEKPGVESARADFDASPCNNALKGTEECADSELPVLRDETRLIAVDASAAVGLLVGLAIATTGVVLYATGANPDAYGDRDPAEVGMQLVLAPAGASASFSF